MRLYEIFGVRINQTQAIKNAARWNIGTSAGERAASMDWSKNKTVGHELYFAEPDTDTRIESAIRREPNCLNDIFADMIADDSTMGRAASY